MRVDQGNVIGARASGNMIVGVDVGMIGAVRVADVQAPFLDREGSVILHADKVAGSKHFCLLDMRRSDTAARSDKSLLLVSRP